ncbi:MAG: type I 3-dehydroquinate dehydratase [Oscillospiraceae bacterium]|nr:type I 3-dehydroquinate dehydratase [Oscillospiraceae bacterium]
MVKQESLLTVMVQAETPERIEQLIDNSLPLGAQAFGMQFCRLKPEFRTAETYRRLFSYAKKPVYVTNYRLGYNEGKSDEQLAEELLELADCGADICDVLGDLFDPQPDELAVNDVAIQKQMQLIDALHKRGATVLLSSHVLKFTPYERVLEIAQEQKRRGADICKIVTGADTMEQQLENMDIIRRLHKEFSHPFLFLCIGECDRLRKAGGMLGNCMDLCVYEHDALSAPAQPLLCDVIEYRRCASCEK